MKLFKNKEVVLLITGTATLTLILGSLLIYTFSNFANTLYSLQIKQNTAVIGTIAKMYPEMEPDIVKNFTGDFTGNYQYGKSILKKYSYDDKLGIGSNIFLQKDANRTYRELLAIFILFCLLLLCINLLCFYRIFKKIQILSNSAEDVIEGQYKPIDGGTEEGDIGYLTYQFNTMSERLSENVQKLREEKVYLKKLITDISHQLKTPLASLILFNELLENDQNVSDQERNAFIQESKDQLNRMEWLIKNMMKMARLEADTVEFEKTESSIGQTLRRSIKGLELVANQKNIALKLDGKDDVKVKHDIGWTAEAFSNIIKNCIEHSKKDSSINICWEENSVFVQVVIQDNGSGISKDELPKIFDRFHKGSNSKSPTNVGIGLYITKNIIERQGGSIYVTSNIGQGTRFVIRLMKLG